MILNLTDVHTTCFILYPWIREAWKRRFCGHFNTEITVGSNSRCPDITRRTLVDPLLPTSTAIKVYLVCVKSLRMFHITTRALVTSNTGNKNLATCFTTLLQNELNGDVARGRTRNIAIQLHGYLLPVLPYLNAKFETEFLSPYLV